MRPMLSAGLFCVLAALCGTVQAQRAALAPERVKVDELVRETQRSSPAKDVVDVVWWIPPQFWSGALASNPAVDAKTRDEIVEIFGKYTVVAVAHGKLGTFGVEKYMGEDEARAGLVVLGRDGRPYRPLAPDALDPRFTTMTQMLKPFFASMLGQFGSNVHFLAFPLADDAGRRIADPLGDGRFVVRLDDVEYAYRLPLGSLLPPMRDAANGEVFPGNYAYNPFTGARLQPAGQ